MANFKIDSFKNASKGFNYVYEKELAANETVILKMPPVSPNKRGVNDIGWQTDGDVTIYGTLSRSPENDAALWQEIKSFDEVNKTVSAIKVVNNNAACRIVIRVLMC